MPENADIQTVSDVLDTTRPPRGFRGELTIEDILQDLDGSTFPPALLLTALIVVSPLSGVPGLSAVCGVLIALISAQMLLGLHHIWLPGPLRRLRVNVRRFKNAIDWLHPLARWLDRRSRDRLKFLVIRPMDRFPQVLCLMAGLAMPFLEFVPFTSSILGLFVAAQATAMLVGDGLIALAGTALSAVLGVGAMQLISVAQDNL